ncbi:MAG: TRAP transporter substrate-binding protein [Pseudomonadota bacterium]
MKLMKWVAQSAVLSAALVASPVAADGLALGYFMGPNHPMNAAVFTPFAERVSEVSGGEMTIDLFPGGALNSAPPRQYSSLLTGIMDVAFALPGYTTDLFPLTTAISSPGVCDSAVACTEALIRAQPALEDEYDAKVLAIWANDPPVLLTRDHPVRTVDDMAGLTIRVTTSADAPYLEALGASPVSQPAPVVNQNLSNGVIDGVMIDPGSIRSFSLHEPANYVTTGLPLSGAAFILLMNRDAYNGLSDQERAWIDEASGDWLSRSGGAGYAAGSAAGMELAAEAGLEIIALDGAGQASFADAVAPALDVYLASDVGPGTGADALALFAE